uniref:Uncharacterized protein n=1 Tax=Fagus sylvatica TaxID=28930 RepID=A0A2N9GBN9_FAGSY
MNTIFDVVRPTMSKSTGRGFLTKLMGKREVEAGFALQQSGVKLLPMTELKVAGWSLRRTESTRPNKAVEAERGHGGRDKVVKAEQGHWRPWIRPWRLRRDCRGQMRPLRPDEAMEAGIRPLRLNKAIGGRGGQMSPDEAMDAGIRSLRPNEAMDKAMEVGIRPFTSNEAGRGHGGRDKALEAKRGQTRPWRPGKGR